MDDTCSTMITYKGCRAAYYELLAENVRGKEKGGDDLTKGRARLPGAGKCNLI